MEEDGLTGQSTVTNNNEKMLMFNNTNHRVSGKIRVPRSQKHSHIMCTFLVLFVALFLVMTAMFVMEKRRQMKGAKGIAPEILTTRAKNTSITTEIPRTEDKPTVCRTVDCILTIKDLMNCIDPRRDPCQDFYEYACGGWIKTHEIPKGKFLKVDEWTLLDIKVNKFIEDLLVNKQLQKEYTNVSAVMKALSFYDSCVNLQESDPTKGKELLDLIHKYIQWPVVDSKWNESMFNVETLLGKLSRDMNVNPFIETRIMTDLQNSSRYIINVGQTFEYGLFYNQYRRKSKKALKAYRELIYEILPYLGAKNDTQLNEDVYDIVKIESDIANAVKGYTTANNEENYYGKYKVSELMKYTPNQMNWLSFFNELFRKTPYRVSPEEEIVVSAIEDVVKIIKVLKRLPKRTFLNYIGWKIIFQYDNMYMFTSKEFYKIRERFRRKAFNSQTPVIKAMCFDRLREYFPMSLARVYVDKHFPRNTKRLAEEMAQSINKVFQQTLMRSDWMDVKTKSAAIEKVKSVWGNYGYPDYILDNDKLNDKYKSMKVYKDSIYKTILSIKAALRKQELAKMKTTADRTSWNVDLLLANANYQKTYNKMSFPAAFLQPPLYDSKYLRAVSYGGAGTIIGHELIHGFDTGGRSYDKDGNLRNWWTNKTLELYTNRTKCFVDQYDNYVSLGEALDGDIMLTENIADNIGVQEAYKAYDRFVDVNGQEPRLPGTLFTNYQVFFLSFARNWCRIVDPLYALGFQAGSIYAPSRFRVNGPLQNLPEFSKAFNCPAGSFMNPKKKCSTW